MYSVGPGALCARYLVSRVPSEMHESVNMALYMASQTVRSLLVARTRLFQSFAELGVKLTYGFLS